MKTLAAKEEIKKQIEKNAEINAEQDKIVKFKHMMKVFLLVKVTLSMMEHNFT